MTFDKKSYQQQYYQDRREEFNDRVKARRRLFLRITTEIKEYTPCQDCGIQYPSYVMDFDHRPEHEKSFDISNFRVISSVVKLLEEIEKCDVVCSNCHRFRTFARLI